MGDNNNSDGSVKNAHLNNKHGKQLFIFAMVFVTVFFIYVTFIHQHSSPDHVKTVKDQVIADAAAAAPAPGTPPAEPAAAAAAVEAWTETPEQTAKGEALFKVNCALCHGPKGLGDGPAGAALKPPPRNYGEGKWKFGGSTIAFYNTITNGSPGTSMAAYKEILSDSDRWALAIHVRKLGKNTSEPSAAEIKAFKEKKK